MRAIEKSGRDECSLIVAGISGAISGFIVAIFCNLDKILGW